MSNRKKALEAMLEALIKNDNDKAAEYLHEYITAKTREIMMGEGKDDDDDDDDDDDKDDDKDSDKDDDDKDSDDSDKDDDDKDSDDSDKDDSKLPDFLKKKGKKKVDEGKFTESPPKLKDQPMKGTGGGSKMNKLSGDSVGDGIKGDALKGKGKKETKAFKEAPKDAPDYKDGVDHKAGDIKNRAKAG